MTVPLLLTKHGVFILGCNVTLTGSPSYLVSPSFPYPYPSNIICNYTYYLRPTGNSFPTIHIGSFNIKDSLLCGDESFSMYDKNNGMPLLLDTLCGRKSTRRYMIVGDTIRTIQSIQWPIRVRLFGNCQSLSCRYDI